MTKITIDLDKEVFMALRDVCNRICLPYDKIVNAILRKSLVGKADIFDLYNEQCTDTQSKVFELSNNVSMSKAIAVRKLSNWYPAMTNTNVTFSSKNSSVDKYWANPNVKLLNIDWYLILNDTISRKLYLFLVPADAIAPSKLVVRADNKKLIDLQIEFNDSTFRDTRSGFRLGRYLKNVFSY